jgi:hypothetical protein
MFRICLSEHRFMKQSYRALRQTNPTSAVKVLRKGVSMILTKKKEGEKNQD